MNDVSHQVKHSPPIDGEMEQFLLAQFSAMSEDWRHLDRRVENTINLYIGVMTLLLSAGAVVYPYVVDNAPFITVLVLTPFVLLVPLFLGVFTARRITSAAISRASRLFSMNLVRLYFQERTPAVSPYLNVYRDTPAPLSAVNDVARKEEEHKQLRPSWHDGIVGFINIRHCCMN